MYVALSRGAPVAEFVIIASMEAAESLLSWSAASEMRCLVSKRG